MARTIARPNAGDRQTNLFMLGAIGLAFVAAAFAFAALRATGGGGSSETSGPEIVVASQRIEAGTIIDEGMLDVVRVSDSAVVEGALGSIDAVVGLKARYPIEAGGQFTNAGLSREGECAGNPLPCLVAPGERAITVRDVEIFGGLLTPGDNVDVIAIVQRTDSEGTDVPTAVALVQNAEVVAVADESLQPIARRDVEGNPIATDQSEGVLAEQAEDAEAQPEAESVTLSVTPEEALAIALAQEEATVWLMLRGEGDEETRPIEDKTLN